MHVFTLKFNFNLKKSIKKFKITFKVLLGMRKTLKLAIC